ncbi:hypothetical protein VW35_15125 [Devosia soli]|uniref:Uncharacterized protein n=1 Tax=Devosia soli TaxID=361041 RepID=A0A0F5L5G5_9HYPH|nr:hypothetical protein [Devosia soli]KKB77475.1 hypothetical protein VW35_15125 [Devosia soli]
MRHIEIRALKLICNIVNLAAMIMVLFLGAVSVEAGDGAPSHGLSIEMQAADHHAVEEEASVHHHGGGAAVHCGAPILGAENPEFECVIHVAEVTYSHPTVIAWHEPQFEDLKPPRR